MSSSEWIEHDGKAMPIPGDTPVELRFRDGDTRTGKAGNWKGGEGQGYDQWVSCPSDPDFDIVAYRIISDRQEPSPSSGS